MAEETKPQSPAEQPAPDLAAALKEYSEASDRIAVLKKYPFLVSELNKPTK